MSVSLLGHSEIFIKLSIPFFTESVIAGFPSPAEGYIECTLDLNELCVQHPAATFFVRVNGNSMIDVAIHSGDILVVDTAVTAQHGDVVIANLNIELTVKKLLKKPRIQLVACCSNHSPILISDDAQLDILGVSNTLFITFEDKE
ncbi:MAG: translesion error-prone DNA polymerase V autoproteolytic subunit [Pseudomonadota bacterium]